MDLKRVGGSFKLSDPELDLTFLNTFQASAVELAKHVLAEVPQQVTKYYNMRGMTPNQPPAQQVPAS